MTALRVLTTRALADENLSIVSGVLEVFSAKQTKKMHA
jgi:hypothetical protein